jgi:hypothetical protein
LRNIFEFPLIVRLFSYFRPWWTHSTDIYGKIQENLEKNLHEKIILKEDTNENGGGVGKMVKVR